MAKIIGDGKSGRTYLGVNPQQNVDEETPTKGVRQNAANTGRIAGNAKFVVARRPSPGYKLKRCVFCAQEIEPGDLYVKQDRWLRHSGKWYEPGPRHDLCWGLEAQYG